MEIEKFEPLSELCKSALSLNKKITFSGVINNKGGIEEAVGVGSIIEKLPRGRKEIFFMGNILMNGMRKEFDNELGHVRYTYTEREKRGIFSFPLSRNFFLVVACKPKINPKVLAAKIIRLIESYKPD